MKCENRQLISYAACTAAEKNIARDPPSVILNGGRATSKKRAMPISPNGRYKQPVKALLAITADEKMQATIGLFEEAQTNHFVAYICQPRGHGKEKLCWG